MVETILLRGIPSDISADQLREDLDAIMAECEGKKFLTSRIETMQQELFEIPECGALYVQTDDRIRLSFWSAKQVGDRTILSDCACGRQSDDRIETPINALICFIGARADDPTYLRLHGKISELPQKYH